MRKDKKIRRDEFGVLPPEFTPLKEEFSNSAKEFETSEDEFKGPSQEFAPHGDEFNSLNTMKVKSAKDEGADKKRRLRKLMRLKTVQAAFVSVGVLAVVTIGPGFSDVWGSGSQGHNSAIIGTQDETEDETDETWDETDTTEEDMTETETEGPHIYWICESCGGSQLCPTCHHSGWVISGGGNGLAVCGTCGGAGHCPTCGGTGIGTVESEFFYNQCSACEGTGIICHGSAAADDLEGCHGNFAVMCMACHRTGKEENGDPCNWCKGTLIHLCPSFESHSACSVCGGSGKVKQYEEIIDY